MLIDILLSIVIGIVIFFIIELTIQKIVFSVREQFPWLITEKDEIPNLSKDGLAKFIPHGFDSELGWVRKPLTSNQEKGKHSTTEWNVDKNSARKNPSFDNLNSLISCYGDSFTFSRQVNDDETWPHYLSKSLNSNVLNFGVGNYGVDQSLLRYECTTLPGTVRFVVICFVPETICRIQSYWKHYLEFGNTFAFKPRFIFDSEGRLTLLENVMRNAEDFAGYQGKLRMIREADGFYERKFRSHQFRFPYTLSLMRNPLKQCMIISAVAVRGVLRVLGVSNDWIEHFPFTSAYENFTARYTMSCILRLTTSVFSRPKRTKLTKIYCFEVFFVTRGFLILIP